MCFGFLAWQLIDETDGIGLFEPNMFCDVHGKMYECTGHPSAFYTVVMFVTCGMFSIYGLISFYSILCIVGKKRDPGILDPELFLAQIRKD